MTENTASNIRGQPVKAKKAIITKKAPVNETETISFDDLEHDDDQTRGKTETVRRKSRSGEQIQSASKRKLDVAFANSTEPVANTTLPQEQSHMTNVSTSSNTNTSKSRSKLTTSTTSTNKHQNNTSSSSSQPQTTQKVKNKSYYPNISANADDISSVTNKSTLWDIVSIVCESEKDGLLNYFNVDCDLKSSSKDAILLALNTVLQQVADEVNTEVLPEEHTFHAEFSRSELQQQAALRAERDQLTAYSEKLTALLQPAPVVEEDEDGSGNVFSGSAFERESGLWLSGYARQKSQQKIPFAASRALPLTTAYTQYKSLLSQLEAHCDTLLSRSEEVDEAVQEGGRSQDEVYEIFNKIRHQVSLLENATTSTTSEENSTKPPHAKMSTTLPMKLSHVPPKDTKQLLKQMPHLYEK